MGNQEKKLVAKNSSKNCLSPPHPTSAFNTTGLKVNGERRSNLGAPTTRHWKKDKEKCQPKTRKTDARICTFNCRSIATDDRLADLLQEADRIKYDIIGLSETKRGAELQAKSADGTGIFLGKRNEASVSGGVGFITHKSMTPKVKEVKFINHRIATLTFGVSKRFNCTVIQTYAPIGTSNDEEIAEFYESVEDVIRQSKSKFKIIMGDFNARIGCRANPSETFIGPHSMEARNEPGDYLASFCENNRIFHTNSFFEKASNRRWTFVSPDGNHKHEIDHILANGRFFTDTHVVPSFTIGSDHRLVRTHLHFNLKFVKHQEFRSRRLPRKMIDESLISTNCELTQEPPPNPIIDVYYNNIVNMLNSIQEKSMVPQPNHSNNRISEDTRELLKLRREMDRTSPTFHIFSALCRDEIAKDHQEFATTRLVNAAMAKKSMKKVARNLAEYSSTIPSLKSSTNRNRITQRRGIEQEIQKFYTNLFKSTINPTIQRRPRRLGKPPSFLPCEIRSALSTFPNGKSAGEDKITADFLKKCTEKIIGTITKCFNQIIDQCQIPQAWKNSKTILIFKKGDRENLENYRPITILPVLYKLFTKCILRRIRRTLEEAQPIEQAGFRRSFSTLDHISTIQRILEASREHQIPLVLVFVDYHKAFDSIEPFAVWTALQNQGVDQYYINILKKCYQNCSTTISPFFKKVAIPISKGVRQGDPISPNLFSACIEEIFRATKWDDYGININGCKLNHLRFADDVVLIAHNPHQATSMLNDLVKESAKVGLKINESKTKSMRNRFATSSPITIANTPIGNVEEYVYLGRQLNPPNEILPEIHRRRRAGWAAFKSIEQATDSMTCQKTKAKLFDQTVLPALCYGAETWTLTKKNSEALRVSHAALERRLVGIKLSEQRERGIHQEDIRRLSQVKDPLKHIRQQKLRWAGHIARRTDSRWTTTTLEWCPKDWKRPVGRPPMRWSDELRKTTVYMTTTTKWSNIGLLVPKTEIYGELWSALYADERIN
ncbi:unnamed protein product [Caenorhabditis angaria]|uniref:Reverse transcriptase domain-containing protein n=1 Tax=Caenorhabditis angaria TaxID=860376 RepID=A0A9P1ICN1_9PELO|nr:unnamed protein product [Caenorhabditis angaria]